MLFSESYFTITKPAEGSYKDKGSKFIAYAYPVISEEEIKTCLAKLKKEHVGARHFCYAWRLGPDKQSWRANDDGEPNNSAGKPILSQIQSKDLTDILIVVVRYFGGTLLGVSGLINAYKSAAADALSNASIIEKFIHYQYKLIFDVVDVNAVMKLCKDLQVEIISQDYTDNYTMIFEIKKSMVDQLEEKIKLIYNSKLTYLKTI
ncbi:MAG: YigZ family protein [Sphingobacteriaceae bacterium]|jgi:uncharacterized YigZ family protein